MTALPEPFELDERGYRILARRDVGPEENRDPRGAADAGPAPAPRLRRPATPAQGGRR
jgi:hypothetical protein